MGKGCSGCSGKRAHRARTEFDLAGGWSSSMCLQRQLTCSLKPGKQLAKQVGRT
jgi:hypothetical protein